MPRKTHHNISYMSKQLLDNNIIIFKHIKCNSSSYCFFLIHYNTNSTTLSPSTKQRATMWRIDNTKMIILTRYFLCDVNRHFMIEPISKVDTFSIHKKASQCWFNARQENRQILKKHWEYYMMMIIITHTYMYKHVNIECNEHVLGLNMPIKSKNI